MQGAISFRKLFVKNGFRKTSDRYFINKRLSCLSKKPRYWLIIKCVLEETNRHSNTTIKVVGYANETVGHIPDGLTKLTAPALNKEIVLSIEAEVTEHLRHAAEGKWTLGGRVEVPCIYRFYGPKKSKAEFRNKLSK